MTKKQKNCFRKCGGLEKSSPGRPQIYFFNRFSGDVLFSSIDSFGFFVFLFFSLFVCFFEIKNIYPDTHSTMRAGEG